MRCIFLILSVTVFTIVPFLDAFAIEKGKQEITIGVATALSGTAAPWGTSEVNAIRLALEEFRALPTTHVDIQLAIEDTATSQVGTVNAVNRLINLKKASFILGPTWVDSFQAVVPISEKRNVLLLAPSACSDVMNPTGAHPLLFSTWYDVRREGETLIDMSLQKGVKNIAIVVDQDPYDEAVAHAVREAAEIRGVKIVSETHASVGETDFHTVLTKLRSISPDEVIFAFGNESSVLGLLKARRELYPELPLMALHDIQGYVGQQVFKGLWKSVTYVYPNIPEGAFTKSYRDTYHEEPILSATNAYDAARILFQTLNEVGTDVKTVTSALSSREFDTVSFGKTRFGKSNALVGGEFELRTAG